MKKAKYLSILIVIVLFSAFLCKILLKSKTYNVLKVSSPFEFVVDKNNDGIIDENEIIIIDNDYQFFDKKNLNNSLAAALQLDEYQKFAFVYLTEKFFNEVLLDKKVELKRENGSDIIYLSGEKYSNILEKSGYLFRNYKPINIFTYEKRLKQIKKSEYKLYNTKSNKYHELTCEYGQKARKYVLLAKSQLPKGAKPCHYCHCSKNANQYSSNSPVKVPPLVYSARDIKVIFSDFTTHLIPNRKGDSLICKEIIKQIDESKSSIDIAIYGYDRVPKIEAAIKRAISRGVRVRLVCDIDYSGKNIYENTFEFSKLIKNYSCDTPNANIQNPAKYSNSIMHNKFYIFDNSRIITGSANLSHTDMSDYNCNCIVFINSPTIADIYTKEFEQMYNNKFHFLKSKIQKPENIKINNSIISVYFSPKDKIINTQIIPLINQAKHYIYMPIFLITDIDLANSLVLAKHRGVDVRVIVDATNAHRNSSKHELLRKNGILVKTENYAGKMHSKSVIIDDTYTIIGSMNFSKSGQYKNDENVLIIKDSKLTKFYKKFFLYLWDKISNYWLNHNVRAESIFSIGSCKDGIDNNYDGKIDSADDGCRAK